jgi:actin related protein 2/3 complex subunit 5
MSKNTASNAFRKIDVDQFNEDNFKEDDGPSQDTAVVSGISETEISNLLSKGQASEALKTLLASAPIGNKNQADKVRFLKKNGS